MRTNESELVTTTSFTCPPGYDDINHTFSNEGRLYRINWSGTSDFHIMFGCSNQIIIDEYSKVLAKLDLSMQEIEGTYKSQEPGSWIVLFKSFQLLLFLLFTRQTLVINEPTLLAINLMVEDSVIDCTRLKIINNDTNVEDPTFVFSNFPRVFEPNTVSIWNSVEIIMTTEWIHNYG